MGCILTSFSSRFSQRSRQRCALRPGHRRGGPGRHRSPDPLQVAAGLLLRQRHKHPASLGPEASGPGAGRRNERRQRKRAAGPALHPGHGTFQPTEA